MNCNIIYGLVHSCFNSDIFSELRHLINGHTFPLNAQHLRGFFPQFNNNIQQDAAEFLEIVIDSCLPLRNLCTYQIITNMICEECGLNSQLGIYNHETWIFLRESITGETIDQILQNNRFATITKQCSSGTCMEKNTTHNKKETIFNSSDILLIAVNRFNEQQMKLLNKIHPNNQIEIDNTLYELGSIITHEGDYIGSGHYYAELKYTNDQWIRCND